MAAYLLATGLLFILTVSTGKSSTPDVDGIKEKLKGIDLSGMMAGEKLDLGELGQGRIGQPSPEAMAKTMAAIREMRAKEAEEKAEKEEEERRAKEKKAAKGKKKSKNPTDEPPVTSSTSTPPPTPPDFNSESPYGEETVKITRNPSSFYNSEAIPGEEETLAAMSAAERSRLEAEENLRRIEEAKKDPAMAAYFIEPEKRKPQVEIKTDEDGVPVGGWERVICLI